MNEAESYLRDLLKDDPVNGLLNRGLARLHAAQGREADARAEYQRAIYGEWPADESRERAATRFELIDYLSKLNARDEVLAELLRLKAELPAGQSDSARRVADLLVQHHAADMAIEVLRSAALSSPRDVELAAHLADLLSRTGHSAESRTMLRRALAIEPGRRDLSRQLAVLDRVLALDPTLPGLRLVSRTSRARNLLAAVSREIGRCTPRAELPSGFSADWTEASRRLRRTARADAEAAEHELDLSARLWAARPACHPETIEARAITQVLERVKAWEPQA